VCTSRYSMCLPPAPPSSVVEKTPDADDVSSELAALRAVLTATQKRLASTKRALHQKSLECERLHFRLQAVSFGDDSLLLSDKEQEEEEQMSSIWTTARIEQAVETRTTTREYGSSSKNATRRRTTKNSNHKLVTVIPTRNKPKGSNAASQFPYPAARYAPGVLRPSALKRESIGRVGTSSSAGAKVTFADEQRQAAVKAPICVDDYESSSSSSSSTNDDDATNIIVRSETNETDDADFMCLDIVDKWTSTLMRSNSGTGNSSSLIKAAVVAPGPPLPRETMTIHNEEKKDDDDDNSFQDWQSMMLTMTLTVDQNSNDSTSRNSKTMSHKKKKLSSKRHHNLHHPSTSHAETVEC